MENSAEGTAPQSFAEKKRAQLSQERAARPEAEAQQSPDPQERTPEPELESGEALDLSPEMEDEQEIEAGGYDGYEPDEDEDLYETPDSETGEQPEAAADNWETRYKDAQAKLSEVTANRKAIEQEHAEIMSANLTLKHGLEDKFTEAKRFVEAYSGGFDQQIAQLEHAFSSGMIPPDELPNARQQYQQLVQQRNGLSQQIEQLGEQAKQAKQLERERQSEIARVRLNRTIPGWGEEKWSELGNYALSRGYSKEEYAESVDYRFLELLNDSMQLRQAGDKVKEVKRQRKARGPKRNARAQPRSADGRYRQAEQAFHDNPNQRGRFAEMKLAQMRKERGR